jgi:hypothetical protein
MQQFYQNLEATSAVKHEDYWNGITDLSLRYRLYRGFEGQWEWLAVESAKVPYSQYVRCNPRWPGEW